MSPPKIRDAAALIIVRDAPEGVGEVYFVRRHGDAGFMANAYVFPGGVADPGEVDPKVTAIRECREECGLRVAYNDLRLWAHWVTPAIEKRRYSAKFFIAPMPFGQLPRVDGREVVADCWIRPSDVFKIGPPLLLPPPQLQTLYELSISGQSVAEWMAESARRAPKVRPLCPQPLEGSECPVLLLPWDPAYKTESEYRALPRNPDGSSGPSRFTFRKQWVLE